MNQNQLKLLPYGVSDYYLFRRDNYYLVDKTRYIRDIEDKGRYLFLIRPRRFGKSLFLSILEYYYDIHQKDKFDELFSGTDIHSHPTIERNSYMVLKFNFADIFPNTTLIEEEFLHYIKSTVIAFTIKYQSLLQIDIELARKEIESAKSASWVLVGLLNYCKGQKHKLYVIIDEYDNFSNTILSTAGEDAFKDITHGEGFLRAFFNVIKGGTTGSDSPISRLFMSGVSPITLDDVTSGFNIATNISLHSDVNDIMGFTYKEIETMIAYYRQTGKIKHSNAELMEILGYWYNHYRFSLDATTEVFNTVHILYFLREYMLNSRIPTELIDRNARIDYNKLRHLIIVDKKGTPIANGNFLKLRQIIETNRAQTYIKEGFPSDKLTEQENFYSLLYYFGLLTISGSTPSGQAILTIPNEFVKRLYFDYLKETLNDAYSFHIDMGTFFNLVEEMAIKGNWKGLIEYIAGRMSESLSLRDLMAGEKAHQVFWNAYLGLSQLYTVYSEKELNQGYSDLVLEPFLTRFPWIKYSYIMEFKYIKASESNQPDTQKLETLKKEAALQLTKYSNDEKFKKIIGTTQLIKLVLIFSGNRLVYLDEVTDC